MQESWQGINRIIAVTIVVAEQWFLSFHSYFWKLSIVVISEIEVLPIWEDKNGQELWLHQWALHRHHPPSSSHQLRSSQEWVILCCLIYVDVIEEYPHWLHLWGFTPVCIIMCVFGAPAWVTEKLHYTQLCDLSPEWMNKCYFFFKFPALPNEMPHCSKLYNSSQKWVSKCFFLFKFAAWLNDLLHCI